MATTPKYIGLGNGGTLGSSAAALFTNVTGHVPYPRGIIIHNQGSNTNTETVQIYIVPNSGGSLGTAADGNEFLYEALAPGQTKIIDFPGLGFVLTANNDSVQGKATHASKVNYWLFGDDSQ